MKLDALVDDFVKREVELWKEEPTVPWPDGEERYYLVQAFIPRGYPMKKLEAEMALERYREGVAFGIKRFFQELVGR